jgi:AraC family transcriptional regulator of adaptative response/methylated-DNA-[protein]-cysteine methyltransferase
MLPSMMHMASTTDKWRAVEDRDARADGQFVYAVSTTGIFCRPSCPSRRPRRDRVAFFDGPDAARRAGFRPCRRCHPERDAADPWTERIRLACACLAAGERPLPLAALARRVGSSRFHFHRNFKRLVGLTPRQYAAACRLGRVKRELRGTADVTQAMLDAGYRSSSRFYEGAVPKLGMTPTTYKQGGAGVVIGYTIVGSPIGRVLVAATPRGVCAVSVGGSDAALRRALGREYPAAIVRPERTTRLADAARQVVQLIDGARARLDLPLDVRATAFQWQVWNALRDIPYGETRSYGDVAAAIGQPNAVRAVARACATNPIALAIPCHRVVPRSGGAGGYRWGARRKEGLLARERARRTT